jgi:hypothetical protein
MVLSFRILHVSQLYHTSAGDKLPLSLSGIERLQSTTHRPVAERRSRGAAMLRTLRNWFGRNAAAHAPSTTDDARQAAANARQDRASLIDALYREGRRLQQEIKETSDALERSATTDERAAHERRLAVLHEALKQKQSDLAKIQARI